MPADFGCLASQRMATPVSTTGTIEPMLSHCQPLVVTSTPELNELIAVVANTKKFRAP